MPKPLLRDLMAPDTEPTDDELQLVMQQVLVQIQANKQHAEQLFQERLRASVNSVNAEQLLPQ